ncbi:PWWP domain-containing protein [Cinnamomum micranthum f. kanehirae]|uniref:PWWP domain-containing protein n=1 Tax=Cinnamomum micranthum f. kanehirae TaxID=337451 RepID=A0A3S3PTF7_9MAGN|nr:PWWP domain-containing protein [Cinnamomum micranthum f. kanehirae]
MGSSGKIDCKGIDATVGGLVWVHRPNGSWWPGQIIGLDELPAACLVSQKSGTPVKLLGREDANIDWYNLEKSKRVKAFRCGDYDEYIEKAKASRGHSNKKAGKYASRKDAILRALELESARSGAWKVCIRKGNSAGAKHEKLARQPRNKHGPRDYMPRDVVNAETRSTKELSVISSEQPNQRIASQVHILQKMRQKISNNSENDEHKGSKRMRGLQDLGLRMVSKEKPIIHCHTEGSLEIVLPGSITLSESNVFNSVASESPMSMVSCSSLKRRCSYAFNVHENFKRKHRHRPLAEVLESTAKVNFHSACDRDASPSRSSIQSINESKSVALEGTESKNTRFSVAIHNNSDSTGISAVINDSASEHGFAADVGAIHSQCHTEMKDNEFSNTLRFPNNDISDSSLNTSFGGDKNENEGFSPVFVSCESGKLQSNMLIRQPSHCSQVCSMPLNTEEFDETGSSCFTNVKIARPRIQSERGLKGVGGKVDNRSLRVAHALDECSHQEKGELISEGTGDGSLWNIKVSYNCIPKLGLGNTDAIASGEWRSRVHKSSSHEKPAIEKLPLLTRTKESFSTRSQAVCPMPHQGSLPPLQSRFSTYSSFETAVAPITGTTTDFPLFNVNLDVRASYQGQHVPLVSLMSKLNGKAIIGHPITVEILEDGHCDLLMTGIKCCPTITSNELYDVPVKISSEQLVGVRDSLLMDGSDNGIGSFEIETECLIQEDRKNNLSSSFNRSPLSRKKIPKTRKCVALSKKMRKLSTITGDNDRMVEEKKLTFEKWGQPIMSCVPLKLVFSRINEALSSSGRPAYH